MPKIRISNGMKKREEKTKIVGYNAKNRNEDIRLLKKDCEDEIFNIVNSQ